MNLLLAGIESTDAASDAVAWQYLSAASEMDVGEHSVTTLRLPAVWDDCFLTLHSLLDQSWDAVVCLAARDVDVVSVERIAINETDVAIKDRNGRRPRSKLIAAGGEPGYWSGLPYRELSSRFTEAKVEAASSHSAGTGLANYVFYRLMHFFSNDSRDIPAGLIHVPACQIASERAECFVAVLLDCLHQRPDSNESLLVDVKSQKVRSAIQSISGSQVPSSSGRL